VSSTTVAVAIAIPELPPAKRAAAATDAGGHNTQAPP
jgi:hypothetical protein